MWDFSTEPEFQEKLDWMRHFVHEECEPLDLLFPERGDPFDVGNRASREILMPLREQVKARGLWACHLGPHLGGPGYGQVKLALMNEILALFGTPDQKARYLQPLLDGDIVSTFSMTEPQAGADPKEFTCRAYQE